MIKETPENTVLYC